MTLKELTRNHDIAGLSLTPEIADGLAPFWSRYGKLCTQVYIRPPDTNKSGWEKRFLPPNFIGVSGTDYREQTISSEPVPIPYYEIRPKSDRQALAALRLLTDSTEAAGFSLAVDIDPEFALSPAGLAGVSERTIVIGLGGARPYPVYPTVNRPDRLEWYWRYPYVLRQIAEGNYRNSAAFSY
jgi:hypothetical protein